MRRFVALLFASIPFALVAPASAQEDPEAQMWRQSVGAHYPLQVPFCREAAREVYDRYRTTSGETNFAGKFEIEIRLDGTIGAVKIVDVLPEKSNPAKRWAMMEAKCLKKARFDATRLPEITLPYTFEYYATSSTTNREMDSMEFNRLQRELKRTQE